MADVVNPHFRVPFQFGKDAHALVVEQDSDDDIIQCVEAIVRTPLGSRLDLPRFGMSDQTFRETGPDANDIATAIETWEPRASLVMDLRNDIQVDPQTWEVRIGIVEGEPS